ncbi:MAG: hypothetical protein ABSF95_06455 [Verrucomicrobiota bacterium]|jgi:hypothetical protein
MFWSARKKERQKHQRFYLLPGMGGRAMRRKRKAILKWTIAAGVLTSALVACLLYVIYRVQYR